MLNLEEDIENENTIELTPRERKILKLIILGYENNEIASKNPGQGRNFPPGRGLSAFCILYLKNQITIAGHWPQILIHKHLQLIYRGAQCLHNRNHTLVICLCLGLSALNP